MANEFIARKGLKVLTGGASVVGTVEVTGAVSSSVGFSGPGSGVTGVVSSSYATTSSMGLANIVTASVNINTITFQRGDGSTFNVQISQSGSVATASFAESAGTANTASYVTFANVANKPTLISSSTQFQTASDPFTGSFSGSFRGDGSLLTGIASALSIAGTTGTDTLNLKTDTLTFSGSGGVTAVVTDNKVTVGLPAGAVSASSQVAHNSTTGYVANQHIDHTTVSMSAGLGLTGGGTIAASRTLTLDTGSTHFTGGITKQVGTLGVISSSAQIAHDSTTGFSSSRHVDHNTVSVTAGSGLSGGGTIAATRTITLDTGSNHFTNGIKTKLNLDNVISSSAQVSLASITGTTFGANDYMFPQGLTVVGKLTALEFNTTYVSASIIYESGSTKFGDSSDDIHSMQGTLKLTGSLEASDVIVAAKGVTVNGTLLSGSVNSDVDIGTQVIATLPVASYNAGFFDYVVKKAPNFRAGTVMAVWDGTNLEYTDVSTNDIGNTGGVSFAMDIVGGQARLKATVDSNDWNIKTLIRGV